MEDKKSLQKEQSNKNLGNKQKKEIIQKKKVIQNNGKEQKQNKNEKRAEKNEIISSEDELDHPTPLLSDYYEEDKEEIKNVFYQNKLKENDNKNINSNNYTLNKENIKIEDKNKKQNDKHDLHSKSLLNEIKKVNLKINLCNNSSSLNSKKKEKNGNCEKNIPQKQINLKNVNDSKSKNIENENIINKENIDYNNKIQISIEAKNIQEENISQHKTNKINSILKIEKKSNNIVKEEEIKKFIKINKIPKRKKINSKKNPQKIVKKSLNLKQSEFPIKNNIIEANNKTEIYSYGSKNIKNIGLKNPVSDSFNTINTNKIQLNIGSDPKNKTQLFNNNSTIINSEKIHKPNLVKKKIASNKIGKKSNSYGGVPLNKKYYENSSIINKNKNIIPIENSISLENLIRTEQKVKPHKSQFDFEQQNLRKSYQNFKKTFRKYPSVSKIPIKLNKQSYNNEIINKDIQNTNTQKLKFNNNYSYTNIFNNANINNIHNNNNKFYDRNRAVEQKENIQNNSQIKNSTYIIPSNFNNVQTTFVVISKKSNSKIKLIPKQIRTKEYDTFKFLNLNQSDIFCKQGQNNHYLNTDNNSIQNSKYNYYSGYEENQNNNIQKSLIRKIRMLKSQLNIRTKNNFCYCGDQNLANNYGMNYNNYLGCSRNVNENQTIGLQNRNNYNLTIRPTNELFNTMEYYDNNYNYDKNVSFTEPNHKYTINIKCNN